MASIYMLARQTDGTWSQTQKINLADGAPSDLFEDILCIEGAFDGEILIVGAPRKRSTGGVETGAAYAFLQNGGEIADNWRQVHKFTYSGNKGAPWLGGDVAISTSDVFIGARRDSQISSDQGSVSRFNRGFNLTVPNRNHDEWLKNHFTANELLAPEMRHTHWGGSADPDGDSLCNAAE